MGEQTIVLADLGAAVEIRDVDLAPKQSSPNTAGVNNNDGEPAPRRHVRLEYVIGELLYDTEVYLHENRLPGGAGASRSLSRLIAVEAGGRTARKHGRRDRVPGDAPLLAPF